MHSLEDKIAHLMFNIFYVLKNIWHAGHRTQYMIITNLMYGEKTIQKKLKTKTRDLNKQ